MTNRNCLFLGWERTVPGRESNAIELFGTFTGFLDQQVDRDVIEGYTPVVLGSEGAACGGFIMIEGDPEKLDQLHKDEKFQELLVDADYCLTQFETSRGTAGEPVDERMQMYGKVVKKYSQG